METGVPKIVSHIGRPDSLIGFASRSGTGGLESLILASQIIDTLARHKQPVGVSTLALELDTSKARVSRFLSTMLDLGWVERGESGRGYSLGWQLLRFGQVAAANNPVLEHVVPILVELRNRTGKATIFSTPAGNNAVVALSLRGREPDAVYVRPGAPLYFPRSATGRLMWAFRENYRDKINRLSAIEMLEGSDYRSIEELDKSLQQTRATFLAATFNTKKDDLGAIAAPVFGAKNQLVGAVGLVMGSGTFNTPRYPVLAEELRSCARELSLQMGASIWPSARLAVPRPD